MNRFRIPLLSPALDEVKPIITFRVSVALGTMSEVRLERIMTDIAADLAIPDQGFVDVRYRQDDKYPRFVLVQVETVEGETFGFGIDDDAADATVEVQIAEGLQDNLPELRRTWGEARPRCPSHPHPMRPEEIDGEAWWVCPEDGRKVRLIGGKSA